MRTRLIAAALLAAGVATFSGCSSGEPYLIHDCDRRGAGGRSVARTWDEALLAAIRRDVPAPTTHARNLFHVSAAMWDAWAAYDARADGYFVTEKHEAGDVRAAREAAISYAAYRVLLHRYSLATGLEQTFAELSSTMASLCYRVDYTSKEGNSAAALGNRIAAAVIDAGRNDGSLERQRYADTSYKPSNEPLVVSEGGAVMHDPTLWQPLALDRLVAQNGLPIPGSVQAYVGPHWGSVKGFALPQGRSGLPLDAGDPRLVGPADRRYKEAALDEIRRSSHLDPSDGATIDIGPGAFGDNPLGTNAGDGHDLNPVTGKPYAPNRVARGDFTRVVAEVWADGPKSETPPGHWNVIANEVSDTSAIERRRRLGGRPVDRLEWDVKLYFALNGAVHDAAVAAWGVKRRYETARPISMIRYMGGKGQSTNPRAPSYDPEGLPLVPGLVEVITASSSAAGERHEHLRSQVGQIAVRSWLGTPDPAQQAGVGWILATRWVPYQRPTFVTPAFPGYVSGHSTFSRAAAEVLTRLTGSPYFPGGIFETRAEPGSLTVERGPSREVVLQVATYYDAADQAGISRLYGGIHVVVDDFGGRRLGSVCGKRAWALALRYFDGSARA